MINDWNEKRLEDIVHVNPSIKLKKGISYPFIDIDKISPNFNTVTNEEEKIYSGQSSSKFANGDTVFSRITPCLENRKVAKVNINSENGFGSTEFIVFRAKEKIADEDFIYYLTSSDVVVLPAINSMSGASGRQRADKDFIKRLKITVPKIEIQKKIGHILSSYDKLIDNNIQRIKLLESLALKIYKEWFIHFNYPNSTEIDFIERNPKGWILSKKSSMKIPSTWHFGNFSELGMFLRGRNITAAEMIDGDIPVISAGLEPAGYHNQSNVNGRSITISASGANAGFMKYNLSDIWAADCSYYQSKEYFCFAYSTLKFLQPVILNMQCGAAQPHVYPKHINNLNIIIPEKTLIKKYEEMVNPFFDEIKNLMNKNINLIKQKKLLLPRLMSNKLKVN